MRLGFDLDEVVVNLAEDMYTYLFDKYGIQREDAIFFNYNITKNTYSDDKELNNIIQQDLVQIVNDKDFQSTAQPYDDATKSIRNLKKLGHTIHFITNRPIDNKEATAIWLRRNGVPFDSLHVIGNYREKGPLGRELALDFFVDDKPSSLESMYKYKKNWKKALVLLDRPWNSAYNCPEWVIRFENWNQINRHLGIHNR